MTTARSTSKTSSRSTGKRFRQFIKDRHLKLAEVARQLMCTHPAIIGWMDGEIPSEPFRRAIETWTAGEIPASSWGETRTEITLRARLASVVPAPPKTAA